jgi:antitoxin component YwqK of YwqJK toxin-antitoxin module
MNLIGEYSIVTLPDPKFNFYGDGILYLKNGVIHRDNDLPAVILNDGIKLWYKNGEIHRDNDLPAVEYEDGSKYWYKNGFIF